MSRKTKSMDVKREKADHDESFPLQDSRVAMPRLQFREFREGAKWPHQKLGDISVILKGKGISKADLDPNGTLACIRYGELYTRYGETIRDVISRTNVSTSDLFLSKPDDVIIPSSGETKIDIAKASCVLVGGIALGGDLNVIRSKLDGTFLSYYLNGPKRLDIAKVAQGDTVVHLYPHQLEALHIGVPSPAEQQKIAECLSSLDELMAAQARKVDALKTHKKGLMQQLFPREGETQPRLRFPEFQNTGEWEETDLGRLAKLVRGPFGGSLKKEIFVASGYAVYEQQHAIYSDFSSFRYHITAEKFYELRRFAVVADDIIMSCSGTMGKFAIVPPGGAPGVINQALLKLTPNGFCDTKFLKEVLELPSVQEKLLSQSAGGAIKNVVSVDQIKALPLRLPNAAEQRAVVDCVSSLDALITAETQKLEALKTHKKGLMQQLFPSPEEVVA